MVLYTKNLYVIHVESPLTRIERHNDSTSKPHAIKRSIGTYLRVLFVRAHSLSSAELAYCAGESPMFFATSSNEAALLPGIGTTPLEPQLRSTNLFPRKRSPLWEHLFTSRHFPCESLIAVGNRRRYRIRRTALMPPQHSLVREDPDAFAVRHIDQAP